MEVASYVLFSYSSVIIYLLGEIIEVSSAITEDKVIHPYHIRKAVMKDEELSNILCGVVFNSGFVNPAQNTVVNADWRALIEPDASKIGYSKNNECLFIL